MKIPLHIKIIILSLILVPITAYLDYIFIGANDFEAYLKICFFELLIFNLGMLTGIKIVRKETQKK